jgi:hypothetical protein
MLFDLTFPCYLTTFSGKKCLSEKVICAFFRSAYRSSPVSEDSTACKLCTLWALWLPREEPRGRSKIGKESQEGLTKRNCASPSINVLVQPAKSGCKTDGKKLRCPFYLTPSQGPVQTPWMWWKYRSFTTAARPVQP